MFGRLRRAIIASWLALGMALDGMNSWARGGEGATEGELAAARALFAEALKDQEAKRFPDALDKFQRVRAVRDTAQVEYRIGSCYEGLGQAVPAYVAYRQATVLGQDELKAADVVAASVERLNTLAKHLGWLSLALPARAPHDMEVRLDDAVMPPAALSDPIVLEPGPHVVTATASDATPFRSSIVLPEGAHVSLTISLELRHPAAPEPVPPASAGAEVTAARAEAPPRSLEGAGAEAPGVAAADRGRRTAGWITVGAGGVLLVGGAVLGVLGGSDFSTVNSKCPDSLCQNVSDKNSVNPNRGRANAEIPLAISLGAAGLVGAAIGAYFVLSSKDASPSDVHITPSRPATRVTLGVGEAGFSGEF